MSFAPGQVLSHGEEVDVPALERAIRTGGLEGYYRWNLDRLRKLSERQFVSPVVLATMAAGCGQDDAAMSWLEEAYREKDWQLAELGYKQEFDALRSDPHFQDLMRRLRLPTD